jgi:outer membrane protein assembly factor BamB
MRRTYIVAPILIVAVVLAAAASAVALETVSRSNDWSGWRGSNRDGKSSDVGLAKQWPEAGPPKLWQVDTIGAGYSSAIVVDGSIYITGKKDGRCVITCLDLDGNPRWEIDHGPAWSGGSGGARGGTRATPVIEHGRLYFVSGPGKIGCYDATNGSEVWTVDMKKFGGASGGWGFSEAPLPLQDVIIVSPGGKQSLVALDKQTGATKWTSPGNGGGAQYASAIHVVHDGFSMIIQGNHGGLFAVDARDGRVLWTNIFSAGNPANCPTPSYSDGYVFWANGYGQGGICLKLERDGENITARQVYQTKKMNCQHGGFVIHNGYIYGNHDGGWNCIELSSGKVMWSARGPGKGSLCLADGMLYLFGEKGGQVQLAAAEPDAFKSFGSFQVQGQGPSWAHPVVTGGRL